MASISARKNKNGVITSYYIRVFRGYDSNGKRINPYRTSFKPDKNMTERQGRRQAELAAAEFERHCKSFGETNGGFMRFSEFAEVYLAAAENTLAPRTVENYRKIIETCINPALGQLRLNEISPRHVQDLINELAKSHKCSSRGMPSDEYLAPSTVKMRITVLQTVLSYAVKIGYLDRSPARADKLIMPKNDVKEVNIFSRDEVVKMLIAAEEEPLWFRTLINLAVYTGLRKGELLALEYPDIDFAAQKITVRRSCYKLKGEKQTTKSPKSGKERTVSINSSCTELLRELRAENGGLYVFHGTNGDMLPSIKITRSFTRFLEKNLLPHRKFHALRHTSATLLLYSGTDIKTVQTRLGHANINTTNKYLHLIETADKDAVDRLESLLEVRC